MTRDDIIRMAREAGWYTGATSDDCMECSRFSLERFAALVAAAERERLEATAWGPSQKWINRAVEAEREACARVCEKLDESEYRTDCEDCAAAIRARGQA